MLLFDLYMHSCMIIVEIYLKRPLFIYQVIASLQLRKFLTATGYDDEYVILLPHYRVMSIQSEDMTM